MAEREGAEILEMLQRLKRLQKLMGEPKTAEKEERPSGGTENMILAAVPFLDSSVRREMYCLAKLMEMQKMLSGGTLEIRSREESPEKRRKGLLLAVRPYLCEEEQKRLDGLLRAAEMKRLMEGGKLI